MKLSSAIKRLVFPPKCAGCGKITEGESLCFECRGVFESEFLPTRLILEGQKSAVGIFSYSSRRVKRVIILAKRFANRSSVEVMSEYTARLISEKYSDCTAVTYIPRRREALRLEGIDQSKEVARAVAKRLGIEFQERLEIARSSVAQHELSKEARMKNAKGLFCAAKGDFAIGQKIILFDDIITTGATVLEAEKILSRSAAKPEVVIISFAH